MRIAPGAKVGRWRCKNHDNSASADSPIDFVTDAGLLRVQKFNKWVQFTVIDVGVIEDLSGLAKAIKPTSVVSICAYFKTVLMQRICHDNLQFVKVFSPG